MDTTSTDNIAAALRYARAELGADVTVIRLLVLLAVAQHEGLSQRALAAHLDGISVTALSRNLADLSELTSRKTPGPGLVRRERDTTNLRAQRVFLTRAGRRFIAGWRAHFDSG